MDYDEHCILKSKMANMSSCTDGFGLTKYMLLFDWCVFVVVQKLVRAARETCLVNSKG